MTVHARHVDVADHQVERLGPRRFQGFLRRSHGLVIVPREQQRVRQRFAQSAVILDQQNLDCHGLHSTPWALLFSLIKSGRSTCAQVPRPIRERKRNSP
ncbi:hypothetical protein D3C84_1064580 [compost metagenome]